jgi:hypothetical protein
MKTTFLLAISALMVMLGLPSGAQAAPRNRKPGSPPPPTTITQVSGNVTEFYYVVTTGNGKYDHIGLHRVTIVDKNGNPKPSSSAVLMLHGDLWPFDQALYGGISRDSIATYFASQGVDVWGMDLAWTLVPSTESDFTFMKDWGLQHDINDIETGLSFARTVRSQTGSDGGPLTLLAWSRGGWHGYALLNQESQLSCNQRQVKAYIPVETMYKTDNSNSQAVFCGAEAYWYQAHANGTYNTDFSIDRVLGQQAIQAPNLTSPPSLCDAPYTNLTCSLSSAALPGNFFTPQYHFNGGYFVGNDVNSGIADGLAFTNPARLNALWAGGASYENSLMLAETYAISCGDDPNLPFDKHLGDIKVPVHYVGAAGGMGNYGLYTLSLLGSEDITNHIVSFYPPDKADYDFGHVDLFYADNAQKVVWADILDFVQRQSHEYGDKCDK